MITEKTKDKVGRPCEEKYSNDKREKQWALEWKLIEEWRKTHHHPCEVLWDPPLPVHFQPVDQIGSVAINKY
jgi:hypothetical protein